ncbi:MAG: efflux RND transporter permease subunit [Bdellovibrionaceae bacterium]|nr:efflux RND transporter permease subunit [Pseudobdellovibrionaceae bacterium]
MSLARLSIQRPIFTVCVTIGILVAGLVGFKSMSVDLYPDVSIPIVSVQTTYPGAGPAEIETLVSRPVEDEISTISGIKRLTSKSLEGVSQVIVEFQSSVPAAYAEQQVRDKVNIAKAKLPQEIKDPVIKKFDPADTPILVLALSAKNIGDAELYDLADQFVKPRLEQINNVGAIQIIGGRKREIHVSLDRAKLRAREISVTQVANQIGASGENVPSGKVNQGDKELIFRGFGEFQSVPEISDTLVNLYGNEVPTRVADLGTVSDTLEDEKSRGFVRGERAILLQVYRQAGSNTVAVANDVVKQMKVIEPELAKIKGEPSLQMITDSSTTIKNNVFDVYETIIIGIILTVITVLFFLGSPRSTLITALSLPVSLIGSFALLKLAGFSINIVTLLALTLAVGLLIDDAIVVIENIYRRMELGEEAKTASDRGAGEIQMAVFAITLVIMAVFVPVAMASGMIGQFLKQFGLTVAFSMAISLFVALTIIPMLAAYFGGSGHAAHGTATSNSLYDQTLGRLLRGFDRFQTWLENMYEKLLRMTLEHAALTVMATFVVFGLSLYTAAHVPFEFIPDDDSGQITVTLETAPGTNLDGMNKIATVVDEAILKNPEVDFTMYFVGNQYGEANKSSFYVRLKDQRTVSTVQFRDQLRGQLATVAAGANPVVKKYDASGSGMAAQPVTINLISANPESLEKYAATLMAHMKKDARLKDVDSNYRTGKPELQVRLKNGAAREYGINTKTMGQELRAQVEGFTPAKFRENGREYEVRVRLNEEQRDLKKMYSQVYVPNINRKLVRLSDVADGKIVDGPASVERQDRGRYIQVTAGLAPGVGLSNVMNDLNRAMAEGEMKLPSDVRISLAGDAENMKEMMGSVLIALGFGVLVIYLILSSLYESFITPITIMVSLPLALSGAFLGLYLTGKSMNMFAILGLFTLIGVAGKNGILLVDFAMQLIREGVDRGEALIQAGKARLRPILMTSFALIAGTVPIAIGLNAASRTRTSMGVVIIGGVVISTILTLVVVPALFTYIDRFRLWANRVGSRFTSEGAPSGAHAAEAAVVTAEEASAEGRTL